MQEQSYQSDNIPPANRNGSEKNFLVCGIGASAGGVAALKTFFENVPQDSGISYIVILHLSPDYDSQLASVLQSSAKIPVNRVVDRVILQPDNVYVVSQNQSLSIRNDAIVAKPLHTIEERRAPVDIFFRSLADTFHSRAVCVVLTPSRNCFSISTRSLSERYFSRHSSA